MKRLPVTAAAVVAMFAAAPAVGTEYTRFEMVCVPGHDEEGRASPCATLSLLNIPPGWQEGDTAAVVVSRNPLHNALRDPLVAGLLAFGTAVLEVPLGLRPPVPVFAGDGPVLLPEDEPRAELMSALDALHRDIRPGTVIVVGYGPGGRAVLDAVGDRAAPYRSPLFTAAAVLGDGPASFLGPGTRDGVAARAGALCLALETIDPGSATRMLEAEQCHLSIVGLRRRPARPEAAMR